jgi:hypothetical protein
MKKLGRYVSLQNVPKDDVSEKRKGAVYSMFIAEVAPNFAKAHAVLIHDMQPALEPISKYLMVDVIVPWSVLFEKLFNAKVIGIQNLGKNGEDRMMAFLLRKLRNSGSSWSRRTCRNNRQRRKASPCGQGLDLLVRREGVLSSNE